MAVLTINHYNNIIDSFIKDVINSNKSYYVYVGKPDSWADDNIPPPANTSLVSYEQTVYDDILYGKKIKSNDVSYMIQRHNWTSDTVYARYDQNDENLLDKQFYVVTDKKQVYKCIDNNNNSPSIVKPELSLTYGVFGTSDGYTWKYMYTLDTNYDDKFTSQTYIPVNPDVNVSNNSVNGTIDVVTVTAGGDNYRAYSNGFLSSFVNNYVVQLPSYASSLNNFYSNSAIYLKTGFGAGQIKKIRTYNGITKQLVTTEPFTTSAFFELSNINGGDNILHGQTVTQLIDKLSLTYNKGFFNADDIIVQTDTNAAAIVRTVNAVAIQAERFSTNNFSLNLPIYNTTQSGSLKSGRVTVTNNSIYVNSVSGTSLTTDYAVGDYIRVGADANNNIRRVVAVNSSVISVDTPFTRNLVSNTHYNLPSAANPSSVTILSSSGIIDQTNLSGVKLSISNASIVGVNYIPGEKVTLVNSSNVSLVSNGTVTFANSSAVILNNINGTFESGYYLLGASSLQKYYIDYVKSNPNITLVSPNGHFLSGRTVYFRPTSDLTQSIANATLMSSYITPNEQTEYIISPAVNIDGDGTGALAYSVVNAQSNTVNKVIVINSGQNYTVANVTITTNNLYGSGAVAQPTISPIHGHGHDAIQELGARYAGISVTFDSINNENYNIPGYGKYRKFGIIEEPLFADVTVNLDSFDRAKLSIANTNGYSFIQNEIVIQPQTNAAGIVVYANDSFLELKNVRGTFINNVSNDDIYGLSSTASANTKTANVSYFIIGSNVEIVSETSSGATGQIIQILNNAQIKLTNVTGKFDINDIMIDTFSNAYANVASIYTSNGHVDVSTTFGLDFNQTARVTLSSHYGIFNQFEYVKQDSTSASGKIISVNSELDILYSSATGSFTIGDVITDQSTNANGIVVYANTSYLKLTSVNGNFVHNDTINNGSVSATVANVYQVLLLSDVGGQYKFQSSLYNIVGQTSKAYGVTTIANTINYPDLVRESGKVIYLENVTPFTRANTSKEKVNLVIKF